jgi:5,10-methylenetetrahydromethanopterin reductase
VRVRFGINYMPTGSPLEVVRWARLVEELGYEILGISDSQSICRDVYMTLALCAVNTERIRLGPRVITPVTRHPAVAAGAAATLEELAPKRTLLGLGSGDSAAFNIGRRPASLAELREYAETVRALLTTGTATYHGAPATLTWKRAAVPLYLAASGPKTLRLAGRIEAAVAAGARQFWMSVHFDDKERFLRDLAAKVAPAFR